MPAVGKAAVGEGPAGAMTGESFFQKLSLQQATKIDFIINMKTRQGTRNRGSVPLLRRADEVIEWKEDWMSS
jgi:hypothetical protein